eukprot:SAG31_NODE_21824_length_540_cov_0.666667_1_plen_51_part_10
MHDLVLDFIPVTKLSHYFFQLFNMHGEQGGSFSPSLCSVASCTQLFGPSVV